MPAHNIMTPVLEIKSFDRDIVVQRLPSSIHPFGTQLIVRESQQALFLNQGKLLLALNPGTYTIDSAIVPGVEDLLPGGLDSLQCDIWYLNKIVKTDFKWGTGAPIEQLDPQFGISVPVSAYGTFEAFIQDFERFFRQCVGTKNSYTSSDLEQYLRPFIQREVKTLISAHCSKEGVLNMSLGLSALSSEGFNLLSEKSKEFGVKIKDFYIQSINVISDDPIFSKLKEKLADLAFNKIDADMAKMTASANAAATIMENQAIEASMEGYKARRTFDVLETAADGLGNGGGLGSDIASIGFGAGAGLQLGNVIGQFTKDQLNGAKDNNNNKPEDDDPVFKKLMQLKKLHEAGVLSDEEFSNQKAKILDDF